MTNSETKFPFSISTYTGNGRLINTKWTDNSNEIIEVREGKVTVQIGTDFVEANCGDFLFVPPKMMFRADSCDGNASVREMTFDSSLVEEDMQNFDSEVYYMFYVQAKNNLTVFNKDHPVHKTLSLYMQNSYEEYVSKDLCYKLTLRANVSLMMTALLRHYCVTKNESEKLVYHNVLRLRPVISYIAEHYTEKIYIDKLSLMIGVSPDYFTKMFKDSMGKTPIDYINGLRVNKAMHILCSTDSAMGEISDKIGFCNANYFHKIFKQYMEQSPNSYRIDSKRKLVFES